MGGESPEKCLWLHSQTEQTVRKPIANDIFTGWNMWYKHCMCLFRSTYSQISPQRDFHCKCHENVGSHLSSLSFDCHLGRNCFMHERCARSKMVAPITHCKSENLKTKTVENKYFLVNITYYLLWEFYQHIMWHHKLMQCLEWLLLF